MGNKLSNSNSKNRRQVSRVSPPIPSSDAEFQEMVSSRNEKKKITLQEKRLEINTRLEEKNRRCEEEPKSKLFKLSDEIWEEILPYMPDPKDFWNMWQVHPKFRRERLLSQVLSIPELSHLWEDDWTRFAKLKDFRRLSKDMQASVGHLIEEKFMSVLHTPGSESQPICHFFINLNSMESLDRLHKQFCEGPIETRAKRVFTRSLFLKISAGIRGDDDVFVEFKKKVTSFLERIGEQIWYFQFVTERSQQREEEVCIDLFRWVSLMPNLKRLEMDFQIWGPHPLTRRYEISYPPFPHLPQLERIEICTFSEDSVEMGLVDSVLRPNLHIKFLKLDSNGLARRNQANCLFLLKLMKIEPLLSKLNLSGFEGLSLYPPRNILQPNWILKSFSHRFFLESIDLGVLFPFFNRIPTLEQLSLHFGEVAIGKKIPPLHLPNLTHFEIEFVPANVDVDGLEREDVNFFTSLQFLVQSDLRFLDGLVSIQPASGTSSSNM